MSNYPKFQDLEFKVTDGQPEFNVLELIHYAGTYHLEPFDIEDPQACLEVIGDWYSRVRKHQMHPEAELWFYGKATLLH